MTAPDMDVLEAILSAIDVYETEVAHRPTCVRLGIDAWMLFRIQLSVGIDFLSEGSGMSYSCDGADVILGAYLPPYAVEAVR